MNGKNNMKKMTIIVAALVLAGCAAGAAGLRLVDLRDPKYSRGERTIPLTFPKIQMALFKHKDACGSAPHFSVDARQTNYATIIERPEGAENFERAVLVDLVQYQSTMMEDARTRGQIYTYYTDTATKNRVDQLFNAILHPEVCPTK